jgi:hypothetical protein
MAGFQGSRKVRFSPRLVLGEIVDSATIIASPGARRKRRLAERSSMFTT